MIFRRKEFLRRSIDDRDDKRRTALERSESCRGARRCPDICSVMERLGESTLQAGQTGWCLGLFFVLFFVVLLYTQLQLEQYRDISLYLEDALAASNLACAVIDIEQYGISNKILVSDPVLAYERCRQAIRGNLGLDNNWECPGKQLISGKVELVCYVVYNVDEGLVTICSVEPGGAVTYAQGNLGEVRAPDNTPVEGTGIYSEIAFWTEGAFGIRVRAHKGKLVDIQGRNGGIP